jgi:hypothetical protein
MAYCFWRKPRYIKKSWVASVGFQFGTIISIISMPCIRMNMKCKYVLCNAVALYPIATLPPYGAWLRKSLKRNIGNKEKFGFLHISYYFLRTTWAQSSSCKDQFKDMRDSVKYE